MHALAPRQPLQQVHLRFALHFMRRAGAAAGQGLLDIDAVDVRGVDQDLARDFVIAHVLERVDLLVPVQVDAVIAHDDDQRALARFAAHAPFAADDRPVDQGRPVALAHPDLDAHPRERLEEWLVLAVPCAVRAGAHGDAQARLPRHVDFLVDVDFLHAVELVARGRLVVDIHAVGHGRHLRSPAPGSCGAPGW
jgi:hypothetical protein